MDRLFPSPVGLIGSPRAGFHPGGRGGEVEVVEELGFLALPFARELLSLDELHGQEVD